VPPIVSPRLELISLSLEGIEALLKGDKARAEAISQLSFPQFPQGDLEMSQHVLELRAAQLRRDPLEQPWLLRALVSRERVTRERVTREKPATLLGRIGFHAPPDAEGMVELGYEIFPSYRGQGYAQEAARALMDWATQTHGVRGFRASVGPWNAPSLHIVQKLGFVQTGSQMDEIDGEEWVFERTV